MWNDRFDARFAGPYRAEALQGDLAEGGAASAATTSSRHCLDVGPRDHVDYERVLPHVDRLCRSAARYRAEAGGEWQRRWNDCVFNWEQWATLIRSDLHDYRSPLAGNRKERGGAIGATGITAGNLGHDYRNFLALEAQWLRSSRPPALPATRLIEAERPSTPRPSSLQSSTFQPSTLQPSTLQPPMPQPSMLPAGAAFSSRLIPTAPPLSMPWMDDLGVAWPPSAVSGQGPSPDPSSWRP